MSEAYDRALKESGLEDVQPRYRQLLVRLKNENPAAYATAVERYKNDVEAKAGDADDPVGLWLAYGAWLAGQIEPGRVVAIAENGRAASTEPTSEPGGLLVHLPDATNRRGFVLAMPSAPSPAQQETAALLCE